MDLISPDKGAIIEGVGSGNVRNGETEPDVATAQSMRGKAIKSTVINLGRSSPRS